MWLKDLLVASGIAWAVVMVIATLFCGSIGIVGIFIRFVQHIMK